jgi:hypothetical protein
MFNPRHRIRFSPPSPAGVISVIALFVALGGTGYAASRIVSPRASVAVSKKYVKKQIKAVKALISADEADQANESVKHASTADSATNATTANTANAVQGHPASDFGPPIKGFQSFKESPGALPSTRTTIASLAVPAGSYLVTAKVVVRNSDAGSQHRASCGLVNDVTGDADGTSVTVPAVANANNGRSTVVLEAAAQLPSAGHWNLGCDDFEASGTLTTSDAKIQAIQVGSLSNTASP